jgi:hypothetical protein
MLQPQSSFNISSLFCRYDSNPTPSDSDEGSDSSDQEKNKKKKEKEKEKEKKPKKTKTVVSKAEMNYCDFVKCKFKLRCFHKEFLVTWFTFKGNSFLNMAGNWLLM